MSKEANDGVPSLVPSREYVDERDIYADGQGLEIKKEIIELMDRRELASEPDKHRIDERLGMLKRQVSVLIAKQTGAQ